VVRISFYTRDNTEKGHLTVAVSNQYTEIEISGPKVAENFRCIWRSGPL